MRLKFLAITIFTESLSEQALAFDVREAGELSGILEVVIGWSILFLIVVTF